MPLLLLFLFLVPATLCAQTAERIDELVKATDHLHFTDTVTIDDTLYDLAKKPEREIVGLMSGDTVKKVIVRFKSSPRIREVYFGPFEDYQRKVMYVRDRDSTDGHILFELYAWNETFLRSDGLSPLYDDEKGKPSLAASRADYEISIKFRKVDRGAGKYDFTGKLVEEVKYPPGCGYIAWGLVHKFEVLQTNNPAYPNKYVLIIQTCPEFMGKDFFKKKQIYQIHAATNSGVTYGYVVINKYKKESLPIFWSRQTTLVK